MNQELPSINAYTSLSTSYSGDAFKLGNFNQLAPPRGTQSALAQALVSASDYGALTKQREFIYYKQKELESMADKTPKARIVQVFIADSDESLPLESRLIYKGDQLFTDMSDQDLFFDVDLKPLLVKHNELRAKTLNQNEEDTFLKPVRVSELKMVVSVIAEF